MNNDLKSLKDITDPISEDIKLFETEFKQALRSEVKLVNTVANYILRNKGKHLSLIHI